MWIIETTDVFNEWYSSLDDIDRANVLAALLVLRERGPLLPRPYADSVKGSCHGNMKELRIQSKGKPIRAFFAFDPRRRGIVLCAGHKGGNEKRFYVEMIPVADHEYAAHLEKMKRSDRDGKNA